MTWVKICGITSIDDALAAVGAGADALGFVFYDQSPRNIAPETARQIVQQLPDQVEKVGVFVGEYTTNLPEFIRNVGLTGAQIHCGPGLPSNSGSSAPGMECFPARYKSYVSIAADWAIDNESGTKHLIESIARAGSDLPDATRRRLGDFFGTIFLDSSTLQQPGGTGKPFDWQKAAPVVEYMKQTVKVVVAGGLAPANVCEAIRILTPWGVDVSSGVEAAPGKKDPEKVRAFVSAVRRTEQAF